MRDYLSLAAVVLLERLQCAAVVVRPVVVLYDRLVSSASESKLERRFGELGGFDQRLGRDARAYADGGREVDLRLDVPDLVKDAEVVLDHLGELSLARVHDVSLVARTDDRRFEAVAPLTHHSVDLRRDDPPVVLRCAGYQLVVVVYVDEDYRRLLALEPGPEGFPGRRLVEEDHRILVFGRALVDPELEDLVVAVDDYLLGVGLEELLPLYACQREEVVAHDVLVDEDVLHQRIRRYDHSLRIHRARRYRYRRDIAVVHYLLPLSI